ncbi:MAG TPA: peptidylprolyl isomerase [Candidatus Hydrogenedentes bacterium]|nr:peptidylprolyl isomerase [Candidatus Hydrogenedentota bacterium]
MKQGYIAGIVIVLALAGQYAWPVLVDGVVAAVGPEVILHSEIVDEIAPLLANLRNKAASEEEFQREADKALREALDQAIEYKILYRQAELAGLKIEDKAIDERFQKIEKQYGTHDEFLSMLEEAGETMGDFRERMRKQIMAISMGLRKRKELEKEAVISESDMQKYYQEHKDEFSRPERVRLRRIFLSGGKTPEEQARVKARMEALREEVLQGSDFAVLARQYSQGPDAPEGGMVGWVSHGDLVPELEKAAFELTSGEVSSVIATEYGYQILKSEEKEEAGQLSYEKARTEIEPRLREKFADERFKAWMDELKKRSRVRIML